MPAGPRTPRLDHVLIAVSDLERSNRFYAEVLGAELVPRGGGYAYRLGEQQLNVHGPRSEPQPRARVPVAPGGSHVCFVWPGTVEDAVDHLTRHGVEIEEGPVGREGALGSGQSVYFRDPDGSLLELISYTVG